MFGTSSQSRSPHQLPYGRPDHMPGAHRILERWDWAHNPKQSVTTLGARPFVCGTVKFIPRPASLHAHWSHPIRSCQARDAPPSLSPLLAKENELLLIRPCESARKQTHYFLPLDLLYPLGHQENTLSRQGQHWISSFNSRATTSFRFNFLIPLLAFPRPERPATSMMATSPKTLHSFGPSPCIALRRCKTPEELERVSPRFGDYVPRLRTSSSSSLNKLTGSPGYLLSAGTSPTKVHPSKPHHVRGGSISSDFSDISNADQIIPIQPCDAQVLVPLLHRHLEMQELITNNTAPFARLRSGLGSDTFRKCTSLWTGTTRAEMNDLEWLKKTQNLIKSQENWVLWCEVVGWDNSELLLDHSRPGDTRMMDSEPASTESDHVSRGSRQSSLTSHTIAEEPEDY